MLPAHKSAQKSAQNQVQTGVRRSAVAALVVTLALALAALGPATSAQAAPAAPTAAPAAAPALSAAAAARQGRKSRGSRAAKINRATGIALQQLGDPYRYGAAGPNSFDCSGLIYYSFRRAGVSVPRTSRAQAGAARRIAKSNLRRGDLIFFTSGGRVYHAAIFVGRKAGKVRMVHAPSTGKRVQRASPWTSSWFAATMRGR